MDQTSENEGKWVSLRMRIEKLPSKRLSDASQGVNSAVQNVPLHTKPSLAQINRFSGRLTLYLSPLTAVFPPIHLQD